MASAPMADKTRQMHPSRLQYELLSDKNPLMAPVKAMADKVRQERKLAGADNPFLAFQETISRQIVANLDAWRDMTELWAERSFMALYGSPVLQAAVGIDPADTRPLRRAGSSSLRQRTAADPH